MITFYEWESHYLLSCDQQRVSHIAHSAELESHDIMTHSESKLYWTFLKPQDILPYDQQMVNDVSHFAEW